MWLAGLIFLTIGLSDLFRSRTDERVTGAIAPGILALLPAIALCIAGNFPVGWVAALAALVAVWQVTTTPGPRFGKAGVVGVVILAASSIAGLATPNLGPPVPAWFASWYGGLPYEFVANQGVERFVLLAGYAVFLIASANQVVGIVLGVAGPRIRAGATQVRGGRVIGPIERLLIFGMALAGVPLGIGAVVAAKGILRYPEISDRNTRSSRRAALAEYVLIGSLASWSLALLIVPMK